MQKRSTVENQPFLGTTQRHWPNSELLLLAQITVLQASGSGTPCVGNCVIAVSPRQRCNL
ncbi:conserved protein of unknown function [Pseudomonas marincola]|uniref:Uncharacterized protein n=1 Tax=Pseudomonas marincola TaxID=437900 RepID=A0A653E727_9PSED|nr:conserved protein of unknown function [Pseudomonas marincola]